MGQRGSGDRVLGAFWRKGRRAVGAMLVENLRWEGNLFGREAPSLAIYAQQLRMAEF